MSYRPITRKGKTSDCEFGGNAQSWSIRIQDRYYAWQDNEIKTSRFYKSGLYSLDLSDNFGGKQLKLCETPYKPWFSGRVAVFLDRGAGRLSFYQVSGDELIHIHTFETTFTEPLYAGFGCRWTVLGSSVKLVDV